MTEVAAASTTQTANLPALVPSSDPIWQGDGPLDQDTAHALNHMLHATKDVLWWMLLRAHSGKIWKPLGYPSWQAYVTAEFSITRQHANNLINAAKVTQAIAEAAPPGTQINLQEATTRDLKQVLDKVIPEVAARTAGTTPEQAADIINEITQSARDEVRATKQADQPNEPPAAPNRQSDHHDDVFSDYSFDTDTEDNPTPAPNQSPAIAAYTTNTERQTRWDFYGILSVLGDDSVLARTDPTTVIDAIEAPRVEWVDTNIDRAVEWLADFQSAWHQRHATQTSDPTASEGSNPTP